MLWPAQDALQAASTFVREHGAAGLILVWLGEQLVGPRGPAARTIFTFCTLPPCLLRTTPLQFSLQPRTLLDITRETGMRIAVGTAPPQDLFEGWVV